MDADHPSTGVNLPRRITLIGYWADDRQMANGSDQVSTKSLADTKRKLLSAGRRREWPEALKRQMVSETRMGRRLAQIQPGSLRS